MIISGEVYDNYMPYTTRLAHPGLRAPLAEIKLICCKVLRMKIHTKKRQIDL